MTGHDLVIHFFSMIATLFATAVGIIVAYTIAIEIFPKKKKHGFETMIIALLLYSAFNASIIYPIGLYIQRAQSMPASYSEVAAAAGFNSNQEHPLSIGSNSVSADGSMTIRSYAIGGAHGDGSMSASATVLVSYQHHNGYSEILEIPISKTDFTIVDENNLSSIAIDLWKIPETVKGYELKSNDWACKPRVFWGWWLASCHPKTAHVSPHPNEGVSGILSKAFADYNGKLIRMTLTQEEYSRILGSPESTLLNESQSSEQ